MTVEEVLGFPAEQLEKITQAQWDEFIGPFLKVTRPELAEKPASKSTGPKAIKESLMNQKKKRAQALLAGMGIDLSDI